MLLNSLTRRRSPFRPTFPSRFPKTTSFSSTSIVLDSISSTYVVPSEPGSRITEYRKQILQSQGKYQNKPPLPFVGGAEFAGKISRDSPIPAGCPYKPGDRVFGATQGAFAEKATVPWNNVLPLPDALTFNQGAGELVSMNSQNSSEL